jgi:hypothetical protein
MNITNILIPATVLAVLIVLLAIWARALCRRDDE